MRVRFEGGPLDGTMRELPEAAPVIRVPVMRSVPLMATLAEIQANPDLLTEGRFEEAVVEYVAAYTVFVPARQVAAVSERKRRIRAGG